MTRKGIFPLPLVDWADDACQQGWWKFFQLDESAEDLLKPNSKEGSHVFNAHACATGKRMASSKVAEAFSAPTPAKHSLFACDNIIYTS